MGKYFILSFLEFNEKEIVINATTYDSGNEKIGNYFDSGGSIKDKIKSPLTAIINERDSTLSQSLLDRVYFSSNTGPLLLISDKAKLFFDKLNLPLEFYEILIKGKTLEIKNYWVVNILDKIRCIDFEKSTLKYYKDLDYLSSIKSLVLDESKIPDDTDIFLLGEKRTQLIIVSDRVKKLIEEQGLTGFIFIRPEEFSTF